MFVLLICWIELIFVGLFLVLFFVGVVLMSEMFLLLVDVFVVCVMFEIEMMSYIEWVVGIGFGFDLVLIFLGSLLCELLLVIVVDVFWMSCFEIIWDFYC